MLGLVIMVLKVYKFNVYFDGFLYI